MAQKVKDQTRVSSKHQVTIPAVAFRTAGFAPGDTLKVEAEGAGRVVLTRIDELLDRGRAARGVAVVLDSGVVVGFLDRQDALHDAADAAVRELVRGQRMLASVVTYAEVLTGARLGHHNEDDVAGFFAGLLSAVLPVDVAVAEEAADLRSRVKALRMPDALILATAETDPEVDLIVTGDQRLSKVSGLRVNVRLLR
jgi:predicted nucleic acid-binding protein